MFTGIITEITQISTISEKNSRRYLTLPLKQAAAINLGDSVAINGTCLTATTKSGSQVTFEAVQETLQRTTIGSLKVGSWVNIELALQLADRLGGHLVAGHIDGVGTLRKIENRSEQGNLEIELSKTLTQFCIHKGSIAIDGVSLTIAGIESQKVNCAIIQQTFDHTIFQYKKPGDLVNIETDMIGKWIYKFVNPSAKETPSSSGVDLDFLKNNGYL